MFLALLLVGFNARCCDAIRVTMTTPAKHSRGIAPVFMVSITNLTEHPVKLINVVSRQDLKDNYAELSVRQNGQLVGVPYISDPGPISEKDYVFLPAGQKISFGHKGTPFSLESLPVGMYQATLRFTMPDLIHVVQSNTVAFTVIP